MTTPIEARDALVKRLRSVSDEGFRFAGEAADELARTCEFAQLKHPTKTGMWKTGCGHEHWDFTLSLSHRPFCPYCGGRISVKEAVNG